MMRSHQFRGLAPNSLRPSLGRRSGGGGAAAGDPADFTTDFDMGGLVNLASTSWNEGSETLTITRTASPNGQGPSTHPTTSTTAYTLPGNFALRAPGMLGRTTTFILDDMSDINSATDTSWQLCWCYESALHRTDGSQWVKFDNEAVSGTDPNEILTASNNSAFTQDVVILSRRPVPTNTAWEAKISEWIADDLTSPIGSNYTIGTLPALTGHDGKSIPARDARAFKIGSGSKNVFLLSSVHALEGFGAYSCFGAIDFLLSDDPLAVTARTEGTFYCYPNIHGQSVYAGIDRTFVDDPWVNGNRLWDEIKDPASDLYENETADLYYDYWVAEHPATAFASIEFHDLKRGDGDTYQYFAADNRLSVLFRQHKAFVEEQVETFGENANTQSFEDSLARSVAATAGGASTPDIVYACECTTNADFTVADAMEWGEINMQALASTMDILNSTDTTAFYAPDVADIGTRPAFAQDLSNDGSFDEALGFDVVSGPAVELINTNTSDNDGIAFTHIDTVYLGDTDDLEYYVEFSVADADDNSMRFMFRRGTDLNFYSIGLQSGGGTYRLRAVLHTPLTAIANANVTQLTVDTNYKMRVQNVGTALRAKLWLASSSEPGTWDLDTTDATLSSGSTGIYSFRTTNTKIYGIGVSKDPGTTSAPTS